MRSTAVVYGRLPCSDYPDYPLFGPEEPLDGRMLGAVRASIPNSGKGYRRVCVNSGDYVLMGAAGRLEEMLSSAGMTSRFLNVDGRNQVCFVGVLVECGGEVPAFPPLDHLLDLYESLMGDVWGLSEPPASTLPAGWSDYPFGDRGEPAGGLPGSRAPALTARGEDELLRSAIASAGPVAVCTRCGAGMADAFDVAATRRLTFMERLRALFGGRSS